MKSKALLLVFGLSQLTCHQALFLAPPGSTMFCAPNPNSIPAERGVSIISCHLLDGTGNPVPDGTVVQFFTTLGRIPEQGRTNDGVVRVNFESTGRSGQADITAISGGESTGGGSSTTTTTTLPVQRGFSASDVRVTAALSGIAVTASFPVFIGNQEAEQLIVTANPPRITETRPSTITANVTDAVGNPIAGVPVFFSVSTGSVPGTGTATPTPGGAAPTESLDSQGQPVFTDTNGQARDVLRTRWPREAQARSVQVTARVPANSLSENVTVGIN
jgi:hypothetical protein